MAVEIILDAGHGGFDNGAAYEGIKEKDQALQLTKDVGERLAQDGYVVKYIRTEDVYESPYQKAEKANGIGGDYFISFHRNYSIEDNLYDGVQALVNSFEAKEAMVLGTELANQLEKVGFQNLGLEAVPDLIVLRETDMPAVLLEVGFMNSSRDTAIWKEQYAQIVDAIVEGIETAAPIVVTSQTRNGMYYVQTGLFKHDVNAAYQLERLQLLGYQGQIHYEKPFYGVWVGKSDVLDEAVELQKSLRRDGFQTLIISY